MGNAQNCSLGFKVMELTRCSQWEDAIRAAQQNWNLQLRNSEISEQGAQPLPPGCPCRVRTGWQDTSSCCHCPWLS